MASVWYKISVHCSVRTNKLINIQIDKLLLLFESVITSNEGMASRVRWLEGRSRQGSQLPYLWETPPALYCIVGRSNGDSSIMWLIYKDFGFKCDLVCVFSLLLPRWSIFLRPFFSRPNFVNMPRVVNKTLYSWVCKYNIWIWKWRILLWWVSSSMVALTS